MKACSSGFRLSDLNAHPESCDYSICENANCYRQMVGHQMPATWTCWQMPPGPQQQPLTAMAMATPSLVDSKASLVDNRQRLSRLGLLATNKEGSSEANRDLSMDREGSLVQHLSLQASSLSAAQ